MNPSGASHRSFDNVNCDPPMRLPMNHMDLIAAAQGLQLGPAPGLSADAAEFVPFQQGPPAQVQLRQLYGPTNSAAIPPPAPALPQQQQQPNTYNNYRLGGFVGPVQQNQSSYQVPYQAAAPPSAQPPYVQSQHSRHSVNNRLQIGSNAAPSGTMFQNSSPGLVNSALHQIPQSTSSFHHHNHNHHHPHNHQQQHSFVHHNHHQQAHPHPHHHQQQQQQQQQQSRLSNIHPSQNQFAGGGSMDNDAYPADGMDPDQRTPEESAALEMLRVAIEQLQEKPGMFEDYAMDLKEAFADVIDSQYVMSCAIEMLFEQSVAHPQCRYMGAKLCQLLDVLAGTSDGPNLFRNMLCLKLAHHEQEMPVQLQEAQDMVRGSAVFLSELYTQLHNDNGADRMMELARSILNILELLLGRLRPENVKCVCQSLKLCGFELESDMSTELQVIMDLLQLSKSQMDTSTGRLIDSVMDLRASQWGRNSLGKFSQTRKTTYYNNSNNDGPVYYGPDGKVLTEDEASFLITNSAAAAAPNGGAAGAAGGSGALTAPNNSINYRAVLGSGSGAMAASNNYSMAGSTAAAGGDASYRGSNLDTDDLNAEMEPEVQEAYFEFLRSQQ